MKLLTVWGVLVQFLLLCYPYHLLTSAAAIKPTEVGECSSQQGLTITHVYSVPGEDNEQLQTVQSDKNNLVFRHHLQLQNPAGDCEKNSLLKDLLARLQALESDFIEMKEKYESEMAEMKDGFDGCCGAGKCNGKGKFVPELGICQCDEGWAAPDCSSRSCPGNCGGNGVCIDGVCQCAEGFTGDDCSNKKCAYDCGKFGTCVDGVCVCVEPYTGSACRKKKCPVDCSPHGKCVDGVCQCAEGYTGVDCKEKKCSVDCRPNGRCVNGVCVCDEGFIGDDCSTGLSIILNHKAELVKSNSMPKVNQVRIDSLCNGNGRYDLATGTCICDAGFEGPDCSQKSCIPACGENGKCVNGVCVCSAGFLGLTCQEPDCVVSCGDNGRCDGGLCFCEEGFFGESCSDVMAVQNLRLISTTEESLNIAWDLLVEVDFYYITYYPFDDESQKKQIKVSANQDYYQIGGLSPSTLYKILMYQVKNSITSEPAPLQGRTDDGKMGTLWVTEETEDSLEVEWENPDVRADYFKLIYSTQPGGAETEVQVAQSNDPKTSYIIKGLRPSTTYDISVRAVRGAREGKTSTVVGVTGIDGPKNLKAIDVGEDTANLSWEAARAQIDKYILTYSALDGQSEEVTVGKDKTTTTLAGLTPGMEYIFNIWAEKGNKRSKRASVTAVTDIDAPKNLQASEVTQTEATLTWTPPIAQIDGYKLIYVDKDGNRQEIKLDAAAKSYVLKGLKKGSEYKIYLEAYKGNRRSRQVSIPVSMVITFPVNCVQVRMAGNRNSGVYTIYPGGENTKGISVYCDQDTDGGGWTVIQRRNNGKLDFYQRWRTYVDGFGDPNEEFWLGLDSMHKLTSTPVQYELRVDLRTEDETAYAVYRTFSVGSSKDRYKLTVGDYSGTAGDALTYHNGWKFTTWDKDNDIALTNCALSHQAAFWYKNCHLANPNGRYGDNNHSMGVNWEPWKGHEFSIQFIELKIRPLDSSARVV
ncbi:PREDICTED: tenascin-N-like [Nanorana parkeri]|uniref:tenascin-N-like n=1 Tax=Nanorana parkeri TaxID=125878 RepID=UPI000854D7D3|nr:PREDICTED: tenascin-N-like [Nanorana parkeri]